MLKLYGGARSRASIVQWYLEELGVDYEFILLDMNAGEHRQADYLAINPMGKVPSIVDGDLKLWESGAILLYLVEKHGSEPLSLEQRSEFMQWVIFGNATLGPGLFIESSREQEQGKLLPPLNERFQQHPFLLGDQFTVADVAVGSLLVYAQLMLQMDYADYPAIATYVKAIAQRPAFQKTIGAR